MNEKVNAIATLAALVLITATVAYANYVGVDTHNATHWLVTYENGFIQRGFVGTVAEAMFGHRAFSYAFINQASLVLLIALSIEVAILCFVFLRRTPSLGAVALCLLFLTGPGTLSFLASDVGRFDTINYIIMISIMLFLIKPSGDSRLIGVVLGPACAIGILVHEAFVVICLPIISMIIITTYKNNRTTLLSFIVPVIIVFIPVAIFGRSSIDKSVFSNILQMRADFPIRGFAVDTFYRGFKESLELKSEYVADPNNNVVYLPMIAAVAPGLVAGLIVWLWSAKRDLRSILIVVAAAGPLLLFPIALDDGRWIALTTFNAFLAMIWTSIKFAPPASEARPDIPLSLLLVALAVVIASIAAGHVPIMHGLPSGLASTQ